MLNDILQQYVKAGFPEAQGFSIRGVFVSGNCPEGRLEAAHCRKIPDDIRTVTGLDFLLVFWANPWAAMTADERHVLICHELHHIANKDDKPAIRPHGDDFCEIPHHDKKSQEIAAAIKPSSLLAAGKIQVTFPLKEGIVKEPPGQDDALAATD